jgi:hypothetical protein
MAIAPAPQHSRNDGLAKGGMSVDHVRRFPIGEQAGGQQAPVKILKNGVMVPAKPLPDGAEAPDFLRRTQDFELQHVV